MNDKLINTLMWKAGAKFEMMNWVHYDDFSYEKFAELIVKECVSICENTEIPFDIEVWRDTDITDYEALMTQAVTPKKAGNVKNELENDVIDFISKCDSLKPDHLIISSLKWKYLMRSVLRGKNILMTGPSGCGKTLAAQSVAEVLDGRQFFYFNVGATQDPRSTLIGNTHYSKDKGTFVAEALFVKAIQTPNAFEAFSIMPCFSS